MQGLECASCDARRNEGTDKKSAFASSHCIYMALHQFNLLFRLLSGLGLANMEGGRG